MDFPFNSTELQALDGLVQEYGALASHRGMDRPRMIRMIVAGGICAMKETRQKAVPPTLEVTTTIECWVLDSDMSDLAEIQAKTGLPWGAVLRLVVVEGYAYVCTAIEDFKKGAKVAHPHTPSSGDN